jgi:acetolactate synthase I/II/III large subunit
MIKLSDYIADTLVKNGISDVFMVTGGGAMHLNDALGKCSKLNIVYSHHEQASAIAAESYARLTGKLAVVNVTTGPGGINAINGVFGAWTDSIPMLIISGQVRYDTTIASSGMNLRQLGDQECDIIASVKPMTKYAVMLDDPSSIAYHLTKAIEIAQTGRPGPVWIDIPINIQGAMLNPTALEQYTPKQSNITALNDTDIAQTLKLIDSAQRPVILAGAGVRIARAEQELLTLVDKLHIPVVTAWNAHDLITNDSPYYCGRPGSIGDRSGNYTVQNSDLLLVLGSRLNIRQISYNWQSFARDAYIIAVDIDKLEMDKPTLKIDLKIHADLKDFTTKLLAEVERTAIADKQQWLAWCRQRKTKYPVVLPEYWHRDKLVNPYCFMHSLSKQLPEGQITITGNGTACVTAFQAMIIKQKQRLYTNSGCASMGYDLPAAIGANIGSGGKRIICIAGDGSIMMNIQELASIAFLQLNIKIFILNNNGYHSIRQTQENFFGKPYVGCGPESGLGFPDFSKLAAGFDISYLKCNNHHEMEQIIAECLADNKPHICEVMLTPEQAFAPKVSSSKRSDGTIVSRPLEDMAPFLPRDEFLTNMLIKPLAASEEIA